MKIIIARHGRPDCDLRTAVLGRDFAEWVRLYNASGIARTPEPPGELVAVAAEAAVVATSPLRRALESAAAVAPSLTPIVADHFREADVPTKMTLPVSLSPQTWTLLARAAWIAGWSDGAESVRAVRQRAGRAADHLSDLAGTHGNVLLVAHGFINHLIRREFVKRGWRSARIVRGSYWASAALSCAA